MIPLGTTCSDLGCFPSLQGVDGALAQEPESTQTRKAKMLLLGPTKPLNETCIRVGAHTET